MRLQTLKALKESIKAFSELTNGKAVMFTIIIVAISIPLIGITSF